MAQWDETWIWRELKRNSMLGHSDGDTVRWSNRRVFLAHLSPAQTLAPWQTFTSKMSPWRWPLCICNDTTPVEYGTAVGDRGISKEKIILGEVCRAQDWNGIHGEFDGKWVSGTLLFYPFLTGLLFSLDLLFSLLWSPCPAYSRDPLSMVLGSRTHNHHDPQT